MDLIDVKLPDLHIEQYDVPANVVGRSVLARFNEEARRTIDEAVAAIAD